jgi:putative chitinase
MRGRVVKLVEWEAVLKQIAPSAKLWIVDGVVDAMPIVVERYEINTPLRQQHFLATLAHESDYFRTTTEYASGAAYEGRKDLGNIQKGDGRKYKGRGLIQLTGRFNYAAATKAFKTDFIADPDLVARFPAAIMVSAWWWKNHGLNEVADQDDCKGVCKIVNGGYNGLNSRIDLTRLAGVALT